MVAAQPLWTTTTVDDGAALVALLSAQPPPAFDVVFSDIMMPVMGGLQAMASLRALGITLPAVALTANAQQHDRELCMQAGFDAFISKPFAAQDLYHATVRLFPACLHTVRTSALAPPSASLAAWPEAATASLPATLPAASPAPSDPAAAPCRSAKVSRRVFVGATLDLLQTAASASPAAAAAVRARGERGGRGGGGRLQASKASFARALGLLDEEEEDKEDVRLDLRDTGVHEALDLL